MAYGVQRVQQRHKAKAFHRLRVCVDGQQRRHFAPGARAQPFTVPLSAICIQVFGQDAEGELPLAIFHLPDLEEAGDTQRLYAATDVGVYWSANLGTSWTPLGTGLPFTAVFDLTLHAPSHTLIAATHGRSQWTLDVTPTAIAVSPENGPSRIALSPPAPNPSRGATSLTLELSRAGQADVIVFDAGGRRVRTLLAGRLDAGSHTLGWDGTDDAGTRVGAGVYFVRARAAEGTARRRIVKVE